MTNNQEIKEVDKNKKYVEKACKNMKKTIDNLKIKAMLQCSDETS
jgi:hypothetical protein